jgi:hypothetical protein
VPGTARRLIAIALVLAVGIAGVLLYQSVTAPSDKERMEAAVYAFGYADNRMTPAQVRAWFGEPDAVFRNNPRALCWSYATPYKVRMCWGAKRKAAWISHNVPSRLSRELIEDR